MNDERTLTHLHLLRALNPYPVVAINSGPGNPVAESIDVGRLVSSSPASVWEAADAVLVGWFRHRGIDAQRYIYFEWDTLATMPAREYYREVWDCDVAAANVFLPGRDDWGWFHQLSMMPAELARYGAGLMPFNGLLLSHRALVALSDMELPVKVFSELRIGTLLRKKGFTLTQLPEHRRITNSWRPDLRVYDPTEPGIYHPVKSERYPLGPDRGNETAGVGSKGAVDLLNIIDIARDCIEGGWERDGVSLVSSTSHQGRLRLPIAVTQDYRLDVVVRREAGADGVACTLPIGVSQCTLLLDGYGGRLCGIEAIDGNNVDNNQTRREGSLFAGGAPRRITIAVSGDHVQVNCDGNLVVAWEGDVRSLQPTDVCVHTDRIYLTAWRSRYRLTKVALTFLDS